MMGQHIEDKMQVERSGRQQFPVLSDHRSGRFLDQHALSHRLRHIAAGTADVIVKAEVRTCFGHPGKVDRCVVRIKISRPVFVVNANID